MSNTANVYDGIFQWDGWGGPLRLGSGKCRLRIHDLTKDAAAREGIALLKPVIVLVTDMDDSPLSVRSCAGHIATRVTADYHIDPGRMVYVEYYPRVVYGEQSDRVIAERIEAADFNWQEGRAMQPRWRPVPPEMKALCLPLVAGWDGIDPVG